MKGVENAHTNPAMFRNLGNAANMSGDLTGS